VDVMTVAKAIEIVRQRTPPNYRVDSRDLARAAIQAMGFEVDEAPLFVPTPQPAPSGVVRSPDGVWTNSLSDAIAPLFVPAPPPASPTDEGALLARIAELEAEVERLRAAPPPASPTDEWKAALLALLDEIETLLRSLGILGSNGASYGSTNMERLRLLASIDRGPTGGAK